MIVCEKVFVAGGGYRVAVLQNARGCFVRFKFGADAGQVRCESLDAARALYSFIVDSCPYARFVLLREMVVN